MRALIGLDISRTPSIYKTKIIPDLSFKVYAALLFYPPPAILTFQPWTVPMQYPTHLQKVINVLNVCGVGTKSAERFAFHMLIGPMNIYLKWQ